MSDRPIPRPTACSKPYFDAAREGKLKLQYCPDSKRYQHYARPYDITSMSDRVEWREMSGRGKIYSYVVNTRPANPGMADKVPYAVALVELDDAPGVRIMVNIIDSNVADVAIGKPVVVAFEKLSDDVTLPQFKLA